MSSTDHCAASRLTRCMGAVSLVIEPCLEEPGRTLVFLEDDTGQRKSALFNVRPMIATKLRIDADSQFFSTPHDAHVWLLRQSMDFGCPSASSRSTA